MLTWDPTTRTTPEDALRHPWILQNAEPVPAGQHTSQQPAVAHPEPVASKPIPAPHEHQQMPPALVPPPDMQHQPLPGTAATDAASEGIDVATTPTALQAMKMAKQHWQRHTQKKKPSTGTVDVRQGRGPLTEAGNMQQQHAHMWAVGKPDGANWSPGKHMLLHLGLHWSSSCALLSPTLGHDINKLLDLNCHHTATVLQNTCQLCCCSTHLLCRQQRRLPQCMKALDSWKMCNNSTCRATLATA